MKIQLIKTAMAFASFAFLTLNAQETPIKVKEYGLGFTGLNNYSLQYRWGNQTKLKRVSGYLGGNTSFNNGNGKSGQKQDAYINFTNTNNTKGSSPININLGLGFSVLKLKTVNDKLGFMCGPNFSLNYYTNNSSSTTNGTNTNYVNNVPQSGLTPAVNSNSTYVQQIQPAFGFVLGGYYAINAMFRIYAEVSPSVFYKFEHSTNSSVSSYYNGNNLYINDNSNTSDTHSFGFSGLSNSGAMITLVYRIVK